jgi:hypothetical protein
MMGSVIFSCDVYTENAPDCAIFLKFLTQEYDSKELKYFIFVRAVIEKEIKKKFFDGTDSTKGKIDTRGTLLEENQIYAVLDRIFGVGKSVRHMRFVGNFFLVNMK